MIFLTRFSTDEHRLLRVVLGVGSLRINVTRAFDDVMGDTTSQFPSNLIYIHTNSRMYRKHFRLPSHALFPISVLLRTLHYLPTRLLAYSYALARILMHDIRL
jgi:hypothetical protein